jgi:hypothetical protein
MPRRKGSNGNDANLRPSPQFLRVLDAKRKRLGVTSNDKGWPMLVSRLFGKNPHPTLSATNKVVRMVRRAAEERARATGEAPEVIPDVAVMVIDELDYEWIVRGREFREASPVQFDALLGMVRMLAASVERFAEAQERIEIEVRKLTDKESH